jgi:alpha-1,2-mannosyltransferase
VTIFGLCGMAWAAATGRWWWMGFFGGVAIWGRLTAALIVAIAGILIGVERRDPRIVLRVGVVSAAALALMCVWSRQMYGVWSPTASYDSSTLSDHAASNRFSIVNQLGMWISPDRGILVWTPVILLLLPALVRSWRDLPDWTRALTWAGLVYTLVQASLGSFTGGEVLYGYRYGLEMLTCATRRSPWRHLGRVGSRPLSWARFSPSSSQRSPTAPFGTPHGCRSIRRGTTTRSWRPWARTALPAGSSWSCAWA